MSNPDPLLPDEPLPQRISRIFAWLAGACILFGCGALISPDVVTRFIFKRGMIESFEISGYMLAACIGLGLAFTVTSKSNIRVDILLDAFPYRLRAACDLLAAVALAVIAVALVWFAWKTLAQSWSMNARSTSIMQTPMVLPQGVWWIGLLWFAFMAVLLPLQAILRLLAADQRGFDKLIGSLHYREVRAGRHRYGRRSSRSRRHRSHDRHRIQPADRPDGAQPAGRCGARDMGILRRNTPSFR